MSAVRADAQDLPFRSDYADVVVSRGSYHFWKKREAGLRERQGEVPVRLVLIAVILLAWGLLQLFAG